MDYKEKARAIVSKWANVGDSEPSIADIGWLNNNIERALTEAHAAGLAEGRKEKS